MERVTGTSSVSRQVANILRVRAQNNIPTELILHSQGTLIGTDVFRILFEEYGISGWSNLTVEYHGSAENKYRAFMWVKNVGGQWGGMINNPGDPVGNIIGLNSFDKATLWYSFIKSPSLFFDVQKYQSGYFHSEHTIYYNEP
jgi:hypothetical protein